MFKYLRAATYEVIPRFSRFITVVSILQIRID